MELKPNDSLQGESSNQKTNTGLMTIMQLDQIKPETTLNKISLKVIPEKPKPKKIKSYDKIIQEQEVIDLADFNKPFNEKYWNIDVMLGKSINIIDFHFWNLNGDTFPLIKTLENYKGIQWFLITQSMTNQLFNIPLFRYSLATNCIIKAHKVGEIKFIFE